MEGHLPRFKAFYSQMNGQAAEYYHNCGNIELHRNFIMQPVALRFTHDKPACKAAKHHDNAADCNPQRKFLRMNFLRLFLNFLLHRYHFMYKFKIKNYKTAYDSFVQFENIVKNIPV